MSRTTVRGGARSSGVFVILAELSHGALRIPAHFHFDENVAFRLGNYGISTLCPRHAGFATCRILRRRPSNLTSVRRIRRAERNIPTLL